jgi:predicted nuclease of predicted toxin-antitoxin system
MKFLVDNQLPIKLSPHLAHFGHQCVHVTELGLAEATDRQIWEHARNNGFTLISKDEDFLHLATLDASGPALVWVRTGNCRTPALLETFTRTLDDLITALEAGDKVVEIR